MGPRSSTAESTLSLEALPPSMPRFNGAAVIDRGKHLIEQREYLADDGLQWGRGHRPRKALI